MRSATISAANQCSASPAAHEADASPQVRTDFELFAAAAVQRRHTSLTFRVETRKCRLSRGDRAVVHVLDQRFRGCPRRLLGFSHDDVQADTEAQAATERCRALPHVTDLLGYRRWWLAPRQIHVHVFGCQVVRSRRGAAEEQRRMRLLYRRVQHFGATHAQVLARVVHALAGQDTPPNRQELVGNGVALIMRKKDAVALGFGRVTTGDDVDQKPSARQAIQGGRLTRRCRRRNDAGANRDQELQALCHRHHRRRHHPGIFTGAPGGQQHSLVSQLVRRACDLRDVMQVHAPSTDLCAQVATVPVRG